MALETNVGGVDRKLRALLGVALAVVAIRALERGENRRGTAIWVLASELLFNALARFCFLNRTLGIDTSHTSELRSEPGSRRARLRAIVP